jgi:molybdenum cofactor biosynthesis enzyme MoaA
MLTEELHSEGVLDTKAAQHEDAAHEKRNWVRLTYDCNNRCVFCLDSDTHDGEMRDPEDVKKQIIDGRRKGATRLILSGGEPTIHPRYIDFVKLGKLAGYRRVQTVTNGRLFAYGDFLDRCVEAGLQEITFSLHGPNARIHDALVGVKGAFEQEMEGLRATLRLQAKNAGRPIVNVDIVINRGNVKALPEMLELLYAEGVREFDLLQVVPFGRAFTEGRDTLFYDLDEAAPHLQRALEFSTRPDVHVWFNRFPPPHLEGFEHLIQDPYKLNDEVRGRKEEFARQLETGKPLDCRDPHRCRYCYLERLCDVLEGVQQRFEARRFDRVRLDTKWEAAQPVAFGGDPASARRARADGRVGLPVVGASAPAQEVEPLPAERLAAEASARVLSIRAEDVADARAALAPFRAVATMEELHLDLARWDGLEAALEGGALDGLRVTRATARDTAAAEALLATACTFEIEILLTKETEPFLLSLPAEVHARIALRQPTWERLTEAADEDVDLPAFFARFAGRAVPVEGVPACILGRAPRTAPATLDATMTGSNGRLEIFRYTRRYILDHYLTKSRRCRDCRENARCEGMHVNQVRAHGYRWMQPIPA